jgi:hypothetical protein
VGLQPPQQPTPEKALAMNVRGLGKVWYEPKLKNCNISFFLDNYYLWFGSWLSGKAFQLTSERLALVRCCAFSLQGLERTKSFEI